jgi:hypothetical protein
MCAWLFVDENEGVITSVNEEDNGNKAAERKVKTQLPAAPPDTMSLHHGAKTLPRTSCTCSKKSGFARPVPKRVFGGGNLQQLR